MLSYRLKSIVKQDMRISELENQTGVGRHALRFYEREGLLTGIARTANGYRDYPAQVVEQVSLIKGMQSLGFELRQIKPVVQAVSTSAANCADGARLLAAKREDIRRQIQRLTQVEARLAQEQAALESRALKNNVSATGVFSTD